MQNASEINILDQINKQTRHVKLFEHQTDVGMSSPFKKPDITVFPEFYNFPPTYPNKPLETVIFLSNSGITEEIFTVSINGDKEFSTPKDKVKLPPGETLRIIVIFHPKEVKYCNAILVFDGKYPLTVQIGARCFPSTMEIPVNDLKYWSFSKTKREIEIPISNKSLVHPLSVSVAADSMAFTVTPTGVNIPPANTSLLTVKYDPSIPIGTNPVLNVQCEQTGDCLNIPLHIVAPKPSLKIDFGVAKLNESIVRSVSLQSPESIPTVPWPFKLLSKGEYQTNLEIEFNSNTEGLFGATINLEGFDLDLTGRAVKNPFYITLNPLQIHNTSSKMITVFLKGTGVNLQSNTIMINPNAKALVNYTIIDKKKAKIEIDGEYEGVNMTEVIDLANYSELSKTEIEPSTLENNQKTISSQTGQVLTVRTSLIGLNSKEKKAELPYKSDRPIKITVPPFIKAKSDDEKISMKGIGDGVGYIELAAGEKSIKVPVISMITMPKFDVPDEVSLESASGRYIGSFTVKNIGENTASIGFTSNDDADTDDIIVAPIAAVILPGGEETFKVSSTGSCTITAFMWDERVRQINAVASPSFYFSKCIQAENILPARSIEIIKECKHKEVSVYFRSTSLRKEIKISAVQSKSEIFTLSPTSLVMNLNESRQLSIINMSSQMEKFTAAADSPFVAISPYSGHVPAYGNSVLSVSLLRQTSSIITVNVRGHRLMATVGIKSPKKNKINKDDDNELHVTYKQQSDISKNNNETMKKSLVIAQEIRLEYPHARVGMMRRATVKVMNRSKRATHITATTNPPFRLPCNSFCVDSQSFVQFPVHFVPLQEGEFSDLLVFESGNGNTVNVQLFGRCIGF